MAIPWRLARPPYIEDLFCLQNTVTPPHGVHKFILAQDGDNSMAEIEVVRETRMDLIADGLAKACRKALVARFMEPSTKEYIKEWQFVREKLDEYEREKGKRASFEGECV